MSVRVNLYGKDLQQNVNYHNPVKKDILNPDNKLMSLREVDFLAETTLKEVKNNRKKRKQVIKVAISILTVSASILTMVEPSMAATTVVTSVATQTTNTLMPTDILKLTKYLIGIFAVVGFMIAVLASMAAGGLSMIPKKKNLAMNWMIDILKGYTYLLIAPVIIVTITVCAYLLFGGLEWFVKPF